jgi:parvulin-like peptidyl-prolyl isomerase
MIHIFRKEMKKWHTVLWVVVASLVLSSVTAFIFYRPRSGSEMAVATVNGESISFDQYRQSLLEIQERINSIKSLARAYGMSEEVFLSTFLGFSKPEDIALDACIKEALVDRVKDQFAITIDDDWFKQELIKALPQLLDQGGNINMDAYKGYLQRLGTTPVDFEKRKEAEMARGIINHFIFNASYMPQFAAQDLLTRDSEKSFAYVKFPFSYFLDVVKKEGLTNEALAAYYRENKEVYRIPEKRKATYCQFSGQEYAKKAVITVDPASIHSFYEQHKGTLFRIAPKIKVRHILFAAKDHDNALKVHKQLTSSQKDFEALAKQYSIDKKTSAAGGVIDFFARGTHDAEFERAAFRLHKVGDLSPLVRTKQGYEIIQLVERIAATEKPFDAVKDEVEKTLKARKALSAARNDLANLIRTVKDDKQALGNFIKEHQLKEEQTSYLTEEDTKGESIVNMIARNLFSSDKRKNTVGYLVNKDTYIIYNLIDVQKSSVPTLDQIKDKVMADCYQNRAEDRAKKVLKELKGQLLEKKMTLEQVAAKYGMSLVTTKKTTVKAGISELGQNKSLQGMFFTLDDQAEVLQVRQKDDFYLVQLKDITIKQDQEIDKDLAKKIDQEKYKSGTMLMSAFIASLHRNAKIEIDQKVLSARHIPTRD